MRGLREKLTDAGHRELSLETTTNPVVNTFGLAPCLLDTMVSVRLMTLLYILHMQFIHSSGLSKINPSYQVEFNPSFSSISSSYSKLISSALVDQIERVVCR